MKKICIFAGTSEGRQLAEFLAGAPVQVTVCVATEYGQTLIDPADNINILAGRLPEDDIKEMLRREEFDLVIDATHPYAESITESIIKACSECKVKSVRLLRAGSEFDETLVRAGNTAEAVKILSENDGNILLTTGSKEIGLYSKITGFEERVYARVLPMENSLELCRNAGLKTSHIIAMQGPFSHEINTAMLKFIKAAWLVTKDGGDAGGFEDKITAAKEAGVRVLVIGRPEQKEGISYADTIRLLCRDYGCTRKPHVVIAGIGPGSRASMTGEVRSAVENAQCLIGASRMNEAVRSWNQPCFNAVAPADITDIINSHYEYDRFTVLMSGDTGFFSGTKKLLDMLEGCSVEVLPGLSSLSVLCSRLKTSYEDIKTFSLHGRDLDIIPVVRKYSRVFTLIGGNDGINRLCRSLCSAGMQEAKISVGERLSYPDEKITTGTAGELADGIFQSLSAALIEWRESGEAPEETDTSAGKSSVNNRVRNIVTHGLPDSAFTRGDSPEGIVPMTKREIRSVALSMLELSEDSICWDVGAGTGSVAIEMALQAKNGSVYAIEKKDAAADLIEVNKKNFGVRNISVIRGSAPEALKDLLAPTHVFIGGSSGNIKEIISVAKGKNPEVKIAATAIALESAAELTSCMKEYGSENSEVIQLSAARNRKAGSYNLMTGQNPVYIFSL